MIRPSETDDWVLGAGWTGLGSSGLASTRAERETSLDTDMGLSGDRNTTYVI